MRERPQPNHDPGSARSRRVLVATAVLALLVVAVAVARLTDDPGTEPVTQSGVPASNDDGSSEPPASETPSSPAASPDEPGDSEAGAIPLATEKPGRRVEPVRVAMDRTASLGNGVRVAVTDIANVEGEARGLGEVGGPAVRITITVENRRTTPVSLRRALLTLYYGPDATPAGELSGPGAAPLTGLLAPGATTSGRYVFGVPRVSRDQLRADFTYTAAAPRVIFRGASQND